MDFVNTLIARNAEFATDGFSADLSILPSAKTMIIGCVDPRVNPMDILRLKPGEAAVIRNIGAGSIRLSSKPSQFSVVSHWQLVRKLAQDGI